MHDPAGTGTDVALLVIANVATFGMFVVVALDRQLNNARFVKSVVKFNLKYSLWRYLMWPRNKSFDEVGDYSGSLLALLAFGAVIVALFDIVVLTSLLRPGP